MKKSFSIIKILPVFVFLVGCMALEPDSNLLKQTGNYTPLVKSNYILNVSINPRVGRQLTAIGITHLVNDSLKIALDNANIFTKNTNSQYEIDAYIEQASQSPFGFGNFNGKLRINYVVKEPNNKVVFEKSIYTEAGSDQWYFSGRMRHTRARIVNVSKNVSQFVQEFNAKMKK